jgi:hypothetical protein
LAYLNVDIYYQGNHRHYGGPLTLGSVEVSPAYGKRIHLSIKSPVGESSLGLEEARIRISPSDARSLGHLLLSVASGEIRSVTGEYPS